MKARSARPAGAFTFVEVLAALTLAGLVLPAAARAITGASGAVAAVAAERNALALADRVMAETLADTAAGEARLEGVETVDAVEYRWISELSGWDSPGEAGRPVSRLSVSVSWVRRGAGREISLSTLFSAENDDAF